MEKKVLEISWGSLWRILFFIVFAVLLYLGQHILLGLFLAVVISSGLEFLVDFLERRGLPRTLGVILVFLIATFLVTMTVYTAIPLIVIDLNTVFTSVNELTQGTVLGPLVSFETAQSIGVVINNLSRQFLSGGSPLGAFSEVVGGFVLAVSVLMSSFYLTLAHDGVERFIQAVFPASQEEQALRIFARARRRIGFWFRTQIILSVAMGVLVLAALLTLGVKHAFLLAVLAGVLELVPFIGPILAGAAAVLSALAASPGLALLTLIVFIFIQQIENHLLVPLLMGRQMGLHPVIVIVALLIGAEAGGFLGLIVSVPAAVVAQEVIEELAGKGGGRAATLS